MTTLPYPLRAALAIARADFLERVRRYGFLLALGFVVWLAWLAADGRILLQLDEWRGVRNAAWVGALLSSTATTFLSLIGFYLVRGAVQRDRETGVGEILATTPLGRSSYLLGKLGAGAAYLGTLVLLLALASVALVATRGEVGELDLWALWSPFLLLALPALIAAAGAAVLFDVLPGLRGGFGNVAWFFVWALGLAAGFLAGPSWDLAGLAMLRSQMRGTLLSVYGLDVEGFQLTISGSGPPATHAFLWSGIEWSAAMVAARLLWTLAGVGLALAGTPLFDRFDQARGPLLRLRPARGPQASSLPGAAEVEFGQANNPLGMLEANGTRGANGLSARPLAAPRASVSSSLAAAASSLASSAGSFAWLALAEMRRVLKGRAGWWWLMSVGLVVASGMGATAEGAGLAGLALLWPVLLWSSLGAPDPVVDPLLLSCPSPLSRPLAARLLAGATLGLPFALGPVLRALDGADPTRVAVAVTCLLFPPSLALALGSWSRTPKVFEAGYTALWYVAVQTPSVDFLGATAAPHPLAFLLATPLLLWVAAAGVSRRLR